MDINFLKANFGLEREGLRVNSDGELVLTPHPTIFGDKTTNKFLTTDFSESQIEIISPILKSVEEAYENLNAINEIVISNLDEDEYFWNQSIPSILPNPENIPIAKYNDSEKGIAAMEYRKDLAKRYGTQVQLISGIHYNFSFDDELLEELYKDSDKDLPFKEFKNDVYLKLVRNYLRYYWLIIYLTGATPAAHESFTNKSLNLLNESDNDGGFYNSNMISLRNGSTGYKNLYPLYPSYDSVPGFKSDIESFISSGKLSSLKELYSPIRFKSKSNDNNLDTLLNEGIEYVELRTIDVNPFEKLGVSLDDLEFIHIFLLYLLFKEEENGYSNWQEEGLLNSERVADNGLDPDLVLSKNGEDIGFKEWALIIFDEINDLNIDLNLGKDDLIDSMRNRVVDSSETYAARLLSLISSKGYVKAHIDLALDYKLDCAESNKVKSDLVKKYEDLVLS